MSQDKPQRKRERLSLVWHHMSKVSECVHPKTGCLKFPSKSECTLDVRLAGGYWFTFSLSHVLFDLSHSLTFILLPTYPHAQTLTHMHTLEHSLACTRSNPHMYTL